VTRSREILEKYGKGRYQHMFDLDALYPEVRMFGEQCISAEVRPGWRDLLIPVLEVLKANACTVSQIKQKFGGLVVYWNYPDHIESAREEWREQTRGMRYDDPNRPRIPLEDESDAIDVKVGPVVARAETLSFRTCEECGADIGREGGPCHLTRCDNCKTKDRR
jgi:hypothetical protein